MPKPIRLSPIALALALAALALGATVSLAQTSGTAPGDRNLSDKLEKNDGVIPPPGNAAPGMVVKPPPGETGTMPVIKPGELPGRGPNTEAK